ncbi:unannotated protein [freshwater metagenome]|uniref:Unannotated protein n=1 Tax=freshwater metagenome TaxID=449393 RepID=A0A6J7EE65_9ZZZZ
MEARGERDQQQRGHRRLELVAQTVEARAEERVGSQDAANDQRRAESQVDGTGDERDDRRDRRRPRETHEAIGEPAEREREQRRQQQLQQPRRSQHGVEEGHRRQPQHAERPDPHRPAPATPLGDQQRDQQQDQPGAEKGPEARKPPRQHNAQAISEPLQRHRVMGALGAHRLSLDGVRDGDAEMPKDGGQHVDAGDDALEVRRRGGQRPRPTGQARYTGRQQLRAPGQRRRLHHDQQVLRTPSLRQLAHRLVAALAGRQAGDDDPMHAQQRERARGDIGCRPERDSGDAAIPVGGDDRLALAAPGDPGVRDPAPGQRPEQPGRELCGSTRGPLPLELPAVDAPAAGSILREAQLGRALRGVGRQRDARPLPDVEQRLDRVVGPLRCTAEPEGEWPDQIEATENGVEFRRRLGSLLDREDVRQREKGDHDGARRGGRPRLRLRMRRRGQQRECRGGARGECREHARGAGQPSGHCRVF